MGADPLGELFRLSAMVTDHTSAAAASTTAATRTGSTTTRNADSNAAAVLTVSEEQPAREGSPGRRGATPLTVRGTIALLHSLPPHSASSALRQRLLAIPAGEQRKRERASWQ
jgi:hypothetical protein